MPTKESRLAAAMIPPLSSSAGLCWMSAFTGTAKNPAQKPSMPSSAADPDMPCGRDAEREAGARHADRSERNQPVLDLVVAHPSSGHAADADAHGEHGVQVAGFGLADVQHIGPVDDDGGEEQRTEKPEVGVAQHGQKQRLVLAHFTDLHPEIADECSGGRVSPARRPAPCRCRGW